MNISSNVMICAEPALHHALIDRVYDVGKIIDRLGEMNSAHRWEVEELKDGPGPTIVTAAEQHAMNLEAEVERLKAELGDSMPAEGESRMSPSNRQ